MPNHIIMPGNGYLEDDLLRLAEEYGDEEYIANELPEKIKVLWKGSFSIENDNKYWSFIKRNNIWRCLQADVYIQNPEHPRYRPI